MNRNWLLIPLLSIASQTGVMSQPATILPPYVSVHIGSIFPARDNFSRIYEDGHALIFGADLGWYFATHMNVFIKGLYYRKSGTPTYTELATEIKGGHAQMKELILLLGLNRPFELSELYTLDASCAIATAYLWEDASTADNVDLQVPSTSAGGVVKPAGLFDNIGFSLGIGLERIFPGSNFAVIAEGKYIFLHDVDSGDLGGPTATLGLRYYFVDREVKK